MTNVLGKDVVIRIYQGGWKFYACATSCSLTVSTSTVETSTTGSGKWGSFLPQKHTWSGTFDGVVNLDEPLTLYHLRALQIAMTPINVQYERTDERNNSYTDEGIGYIVNSSDTGQMDDIATFSFEVQGTGELIQALTHPGRILNEDGSFMLDEDGNYILTE